MRLLLLLLSVSAAAQSNVSAILLDSNSYPTLGAKITWTGTGSFDVYGKVFQYKQDCTQIAWLPSNELVTVSSNSYNHFPPADAYGWGGYWCYGVAVSGSSTIVSVPLPVTMGMKWYVNLYYFNSDCSPLQGPPSYPPQFNIVVTRIQDGTAVLPQSEGTNPYRYAGFMRLKSYGKVNVQVTTPFGRIYTFTNVLSIGGVPNEDDAAPYLEVDLKPGGSEALCKVQNWNYMQAGVNNQ